MQTYLRVDSNSNCVETEAFPMRVCFERRCVPERPTTLTRGRQGLQLLDSGVGLFRASFERRKSRFGRVEAASKDAPRNKPKGEKFA
jgi:hypothetical protein